MADEATWIPLKLYLDCGDTGQYGFCPESPVVTGWITPDPETWRQQLAALLHDAAAQVDRCRG